MDDMDCPNCGAACAEAFMDVGAGLQNVPLWSCPSCHWTGPFNARLTEERPLNDLSKRLREMAVQRETVTTDEHGARILSAILNRNKRLMSEAADALDARNAEVGRLREALAFYADHRTYDVQREVRGGRVTRPLPERGRRIERDSGERAREAMNAPPPPEDV